MKKTLGILLTIISIFMLNACGNTVETPEQVPTQMAENNELPPEPETVSVGNVISVDFAELSIDQAGIADDIQQSIKTGNITYTSGPDSSADKEFVYIRGTVQNKSKAEITWPDVTGKVEIDGYTYEIQDFNCIESDGSSASTLSPLMTYTYTLYAEIPNTLATSFTDCKVIFGFEENFESTTTVSNKEYIPAYNYSINITK